MKQYYSNYSQLVQTDNVRNIEKKYISQNNINFLRELLIPLNNYNSLRIIRVQYF